MIHPTAVIGKLPAAPAGLLSREPRETGRPVQIGEHTVVGPFAIIYEGVTIGKRCLIGDGAIIREGTVIGDECIIGMHVTMGDNVIIGNSTTITDLTHITGFSRIGSNVFIAPGVMTANDNTIGEDSSDLRGPTIEDGVRIGIRAALLPGVRVGAGAVIGACALVTKDIPPGVLALGVPARIVRNLQEDLKCSPS
ncbi:MAG: acyltransferase [Planctomycetota bacterium]